MGLFTRSRTRDAEEELADGTDDQRSSDAVETDDTGGRRRWLLLGLAVAAGVALYALSRRASRQAEFTEIELDPVDADADAETESGPTSTE